MGLPDIVIEFSKKAVTAIKTGTLGVVGLIVVDDKNAGAMVLKSANDIPTGDKAFNKIITDFIKNTFLGTPSKVIVYSISSKDNMTEALNFFSTQKVNYIACHPNTATYGDISVMAEQLVAWVKDIRANTSRRPVVIAYNMPSPDDRAIINFQILNTNTVGDAGEDPTKDVYVNGKVIEPCCYTSRIAGLLAGLDLKVSATYKPLDEITAIPVATEEEVDEAVNAGKLVLYNNGEKIVIARGVNSLTTVTEDDTEDLKKIKISAIQDLIETDIYSTINNSYIGNYSNSYDNKCLLITAIKGYLRGLEATEGGKGYLKAGSSNIEINVAKQRQYLESIGIDTSEMDEQAIKEANTGSHVFLKGTISILDAIEDVEIFINKE